jgi:hypothetical protein
MYTHVNKCINDKIKEKKRHKMIDRCVKKKSHAVGHLEIKKYS